MSKHVVTVGERVNSQDSPERWSASIDALSSYLNCETAWQQSTANLSNITDKHLNLYLKLFKQNDRQTTLLDLINNIKRFSSKRSKGAEDPWKIYAEKFLLDIGYDKSSTHTQQTAKNTNLFELIAQVNTYKAANSSLSTLPTDKRHYAVGGVALGGALVSSAASIGAYLLFEYLKHIGSMPQDLSSLGMAAIAGVAFTLLTALLTVITSKALYAPKLSERHILSQNTEKKELKGTLLDRVVQENSDHVVAISVNDYYGNEEECTV